jgi:hypothetical protein
VEAVERLLARARDCSVPERETLRSRCAAVPASRGQSPQSRLLVLGTQASPDVGRATDGRNI